MSVTLKKIVLETSMKTIASTKVTTLERAKEIAGLTLDQLKAIDKDDNDTRNALLSGMKGTLSGTPAFSDSECETEPVEN